MKKTSCVQKPKPIPSGAGGSSRSSKEESARTQSREAYPATAPAPCHHIQPRPYILSSLFLSLTHMHLEPCNPPLSLSLSIFSRVYPSIYVSVCVQYNMCYSCFFSTQEQVAQYDNKSFSNYVKDAQRKRERLQKQQGQEPDCFHKEEDEAVFCSPEGGGGVCFDKMKRGFVFFPSSTKTTATTLLAAASGDGVGVCVCVCVCFSRVVRETRVAEMLQLQQLSRGRKKKAQQR